MADSYFSGKKNITISIEGIILSLTNLDKVFWPEEGYTKGDLISYYLKISPYILPHLKNRPLTLKRYPGGINGEHFFQKEAGSYFPEWVKTTPIYSDITNKVIKYMVCNNVATLGFIANLACISQNPWLSSLPEIKNPDFITFDLDPSEGVVFSQVVEVALVIKEILDSVGLRSFVKTTGATGMHVYVPVKAIYSYKQVRKFAETVALIAYQGNRKISTLERAVEKRKDKVYIDYLQNIEGKTLVSVYSLRARPGAPAATPLEWKELKKSIKPRQFNIETIFQRLTEKGDLWEEALSLKQELNFLQSKRSA